MMVMKLPLRSLISVQTYSPLAVPPNVSCVPSAVRTLPANQTGQPGVDLGSRNFNWSLPLVGLAGRAGLDLGITLSYNSLVWTQDGGVVRFNADGGLAGAPGFHLGFPVVQASYVDAQAGVNAYMMIAPSGARVELRQVGASNVYESADGGYTQLIDNVGTKLVRTTDGTQLTFGGTTPPSCVHTSEL